MVNKGFQKALTLVMRVACNLLKSFTFYVRQFDEIVCPQLFDEGVTLPEA